MSERAVLDQIVARISHCVYISEVVAFDDLQSMVRVRDARFRDRARAFS